MGLVAFFTVSNTVIKETQNSASRKPIYTAVFHLVEVVFRTPRNLPAETIGRLNQKFFGRRVETIFSALGQLSRVFSKNL
jgi:hypothetical protein